MYIYLSNESDIDLFLDNLQVTHVRGQLLEETHYYPFGLTMQGISTKAIKSAFAENKKGYNGNELQSKEFNDGSGLEAYDFNARTYDQQIGRFLQPDPLSSLSFNLSQYNFTSNDPISRMDPGGLKDTVFKGEVVQRDKDLECVTITPANNRN